MYRVRVNIRRTLNHFIILQICCTILSQLFPYTTPCTCTKYLCMFTLGHHIIHMYRVEKLRLACCICPHIVFFHDNYNISFFKKKKFEFWIFLFIISIECFYNWHVIRYHCWPGGNGLLIHQVKPTSRKFTKKNNF